MRLSSRRAASSRASGEGRRSRSRRWSAIRPQAPRPAPRLAGLFFPRLVEREIELKHIDPWLAKQAERNAELAEQEAEKEAFYAFSRSLKPGEVAEWKGTERCKCVRCNHAVLNVEISFPPIGLIQFETPLKDNAGNIRTRPNGSEILQTPTVEATARRFATCHECQAREKRVEAHEWMDRELMTTVVSQQLATEQAEREIAAQQAQRYEAANASRRASGNRRGGGFSMDDVRDDRKDRRDHRAKLNEVRRGTHADLSKELASD